MTSKYLAVERRRLRNIASAAGQIEWWRARRDERVSAAVKIGIPLREVGRAAGVDASTVKRIAERQK